MNLIDTHLKKSLQGIGASKRLTHLSFFMQKIYRHERILRVRRFLELSKYQVGETFSFWRRLVNAHYDIRIESLHIFAAYQAHVDKL